MYMEELATIHKTDDGKHIMMVRPKKKETKSSDKGTSPMMMEEAKSYVAANEDEMHCLVDEHIFGKKKTAKDKYEKGWETKEE